MAAHRCTLTQCNAVLFVIGAHEVITWLPTLVVNQGVICHTGTRLHLVTVIGDWLTNLGWLLSWQDTFNSTDYELEEMSVPDVT
jgi:hypothetical protein